MTLTIDFEHIGVKAENMDVAIEFYETILGFKLIKRTKPGHTELAFLQLGHVVVELVELKGPIAQDGLVNHLAFKVSDIFVATEHLKKHEVTLLSPEPVSFGDGRYNLFFRGPSGEKLEFYQGN